MLPITPTSDADQYFRVLQTNNEQNPEIERKRPVANEDQNRL